MRGTKATDILSHMETKKIDIDVQISGMPETPLFKQTKIRGSAKVHIKTFGLTLNWIPWVVSRRKVTINFPGYKRIVNGKYKCFPSISFIDSHLDKLVCRLIKYKVLLGLEELEKKAVEQKKKKKEEAKKKERQKKLAACQSQGKVHNYRDDKVQRSL